MKRENFPESTYEALKDLIPPRSFIAENKDSAKFEEINPAVIRSIKLYSENQDKPPQFNYINHQKKDGILAAHSLNKAVSDDETLQKPVLNPVIDERSIASCIKESALKREAIDAGYIKPQKVPVSKTVTSVVSGISAAVLSVIGAIDSIANFDSNGILRSLFSSKSIIYICLFAVLLTVFIAFTVSIVTQRKEINAKMLNEITEKINELTDDEFSDFINKFSHEDFCINDCKTSDEKIHTFICALQCYNMRQRYILKKYWETLSSQQTWWIFTENIAANNEFILYEDRKHRSIRSYNMKPLSRKDKKHIAKETYKNNVKFTPDNDAGIKSLGVDYVCRFMSKKLFSQADKNMLNDKINEFINARNNGYQTDIRRVINLVAELSCNYSIDFTDSKKWRHLFDYNGADTEFEQIDMAVTNELQLDSKTLKNLIPEIVHVFSDYFEEIVAMNPDTEHTVAYEQWCIIKALKYRGDVSDNRCTAINDTILNEFTAAKATEEDLQYIRTPEWVGIIIRTLKVFYDTEYFCFLPDLISNLLLICKTDKKGNHIKNFPERIFSLPLVLDIARADLLLNISTNSDINDSDSIDLIRDHYNVVVNAVKELDNNFNLDNTLGFSSGFELLQLSNEERQRYSNALKFLNEEDVIVHYDRMYDIFCASLLKMGRDIKYCCKKLYGDYLYNKYARNSRIRDPRSDDYIAIILGQVLTQLNELYGTKFKDIGSSINILTDILADSESDRSHDIMLLLAKFDILDTVTLNFIACMIARIITSANLSKDTYLGLGNCLTAMIFLTYHETTQVNFFNDDFVYLVKLLISYTEPCEAVLGYLYWCDTIFKPTHSGELIKQYISKEKNKQRFIKNLEEIAAQIGSKDVEEFISFIVSTTISDEDKKNIYCTLRERIQKESETWTNAEIFIEYLTLLTDRRSTDKFLKDTPENNINKINGLTPDTVYMMCDTYFDIYEDTYLELCPVVAVKILASRKTFKFDPIIDYALYSKRQDSPEYAATMELLYETIKDKKHNIAITTLKRILNVLVRIQDAKSEYPDLYQWLDIADSEQILLQITFIREEKIRIQAKEYLSVRTWSKYGIASYLLFLMKNSIVFYPESANEYAALDSAAKSDYIIKNLKSLQPFIKTNDVMHFNTAYIDMLTAFINNEDGIQNKLDENACLQKFANDAYSVIDETFPDSSSAKNEIKQMIKSYMQSIERIQ